MTSSIHRILLLVALALSGSLTVVAPALAADATSAPGKAKATEEQEPTAAERRAAKSEFEREALDPKAFGEESGDSKEGAEDDGGSGSGGGSLARFLFGLVVVLGVIYGVHWLLKKWGQSRLEGVAGRAGVIDVVATTTLAQGRALHLVRVGDELVLVGATDQAITRIGELDARSLAATHADRGNGEFQAMLNGAMVAGQPGVPQGMGGTAAASEPFLKRFLDNLRLSTAR